MSWPIKKLGIYVLVTIIGTIAVVSIFAFPHLSSQFNVVALILTLIVLLWYAYDTNRIANESVAQTELATRPVICLYIRNLSGVSTDEAKQSIKDNYAITHLVGNGIVPSPYYIALRNVGNGPAFNVSLESNNFIGLKYQTRFFAPKKDEHAVKIVLRLPNKIRDLSELKDEIFTVKCQTITGKWYEYKYKIIDIKEREVEFIL